MQTTNGYVASFGATQFCPAATKDQLTAARTLRGRGQAVKR